MQLKEELEAFFKRTGVSKYRFSKVAGISRTILHYLLTGKRNWVWPATEQKIKDAILLLEKTDA